MLLSSWKTFSIRLKSKILRKFGKASVPKRKIPGIPGFPTGISGDRETFSGRESGALLPFPGKGATFRVSQKRRGGNQNAERLRMESLPALPPDCWISEKARSAVPLSGNRGTARGRDPQSNRRQRRRRLGCSDAGIQGTMASRTDFWWKKPWAWPQGMGTSEMTVSKNGAGEGGKRKLTLFRNRKTLQS